MVRSARERAAERENSTGDLGSYLRQRMAGSVCLVGLGNPVYGDDGFGVALAEAMADRMPSVVGGTCPEGLVGRVCALRPDHVLFVDAVEFGGEPGAVALLDSGQMTARFPAVSTHKVPLGLLARLIEREGRTRAWLLAVQPGTMRPGDGLSAPLERTMAGLARALCSLSTGPRGSG